MSERNTARELIALRAVNGTDDSARLDAMTFLYDQDVWRTLHTNDVYINAARMMIIREDEPDRRVLCMQLAIVCRLGAEMSLTQLRAVFACVTHDDVNVQTAALRSLCLLLDLYPSAARLVETISIARIAFDPQANATVANAALEAAAKCFATRIYSEAQETEFTSKCCTLALDVQAPVDRRCIAARVVGMLGDL